LIADDKDHHFEGPSLCIVYEDYGDTESFCIVYEVCGDTEHHLV
jgi:hypothetical protein